MPEQVNCGKMFGLRRKMPGAVEEKICNKIFGVLTQLMQGQHAQYGINLVRGNKEKQKAAENLEYSIDSLDEDADIEEKVN